jgi:DNA-binding Lrp family transcriptional regulator
MDPDVRRAKIAALLRDNPEASQRAIAKAVGCSQATVLRDIAKLTGGDSGVIHMIHPGAEEDPTSEEPKVERPLSGRGDELVAAMRAEMKEQGLIPTSTEEQLLVVACDMANRIALLKDIVDVDGERRKMKDGRIFMHPAISEIRQCEATLSRVLSGIQTMEQPQVNRSKQRAANSRWRAHNLKRGAATGESPGGA